MARKNGATLVHFDCFSGAAGNMILGALLDVGVPAKVVREAVDSLGIDGVKMRVQKVRRGAIAARYVSFSGPPRSSGERRWREIRTLIAKAKLDTGVRERALAAFERLAHAEAKVHGIPADRVHFHEVGAVDALGDIVGACAALDALSPSRITASPIALGRGTVDTQHGRLPLPAPATLELLCGVPTYPAEVEWETLTPTGATLLASWVDEWGSLPAGSPRAQGFGAGNDRPGPQPNVLRCIVSTSETIERDSVSVIETHIDDMNPEWVPFLVERLFDEGALDVSTSPLAMKKGRAGLLIRVIARPVHRDHLARRLLAESTAIGVRTYETTRLVLPRESRRVETRFGRVRVKVVVDPDGRRTASPEYEDCARAARKKGVTLAEVYAAAQRAAEEEA